MELIIDDFSWDFKTLKKEKSEIKKAIKNDIHVSDETFFNEASLISMLNHNKSKLNIMLPYLFSSRKEIMCDIENKINTYFSPIQKNIITHTHKEISNIKTKDSDGVRILSKPFTIEEQIEFIKKHLSFNNQILLDGYTTMFNPDNHKLNIVDIPNKNCYFAYKQGFINNTNTEDLHSLLALTHEIGHYNEGLLTNNDFISLEIQSLNGYDEISSILYEFITVHELQKNNIINKLEARDLYNYIFDVYNPDISKIILFFMIYDDPYISFRELLHLKTYNPREIISDAHYFYSYIIALKLFYQYLTDKEKCFYNLNYLYENLMPENEEQVLNFIDANPEDLSYVKKHINKFKKRDN